MAKRMKLRRSETVGKKNPDTGEPTVQYNYAIGLPREIGDLIPEGMQFDAEMTEDGILLRPATEITVDSPDVPDWAKVA